MPTTTICTRPSCSESLRWRAWTLTGHKFKGKFMSRNCFSGPDSRVHDDHVNMVTPRPVAGPARMAMSHERFIHYEQLAHSRHIRHRVHDVHANHPDGELNQAVRWWVHPTQGHGLNYRKRIDSTYVQCFRCSILPPSSCASVLRIHRCCIVAFMNIFWT